MQRSQLYASAKFANQNPLLVEPANFGVLLDAVATACAPQKLEHCATVTIAGGFSRSKLVQQSIGLERLWLRRTTSQLYVSSVSLESNSRPAGFATAQLSRHPVPYQRSSAENFLQDLALDRTIDADELETFLAGAKRVFASLDAPSGYIHIASDHTLALAELGFQSMMSYVAPPARNPDGRLDTAASNAWLHWRHPEDTNDRVQQLALVRSQVGRRLRGTYWGTFLGRELVTELGGEARVLREAPVARAESIGRGALYLQLTASPDPITSPEMQRGLVELEAFLGPVLVSLPSYFANRR